MRNTPIIFAVLLFLISFLSLKPSLAQRIDIDQTLFASPTDANTYFRNYMESISRNYGYAAGEGWNHRATCLDQFEFELGVGGNRTFLRRSEANFYFNSSDYNSLKIKGLGSREVPTLEGKHAWEGEAPKLAYKRAVFLPSKSEEVEGEFDIPVGHDFKSNAISLAYFQLSMGVIEQTEIKFRFSPWLGGESWRNYCFGFGVKHNLTDWFEEPDEEEDKFIDLAVFMGYQFITNEWKLKESSLQTTGSHNISMRTSVFNFHVIASKNLNPYLGFYAIFGYDSYTSDSQLKGNYKTFPMEEYSESLHKPLNYELIGSGLRLSFGINLNYKKLNFYSNYSYQNNHSLAFGLNYQLKFF